LTLTKHYDFSGLGIDDVTQSKIKLKTVNGSPMDMAVQIYFVDDVGTVLDSLFTDPNIIEGAPVDANGFSTGDTAVLTEVSLTQEKVDRIEQASQIVLSAVVYTTNNGTVPVKFSADDRFEVILGVSTKMKYKLE
jgi:hypothetical protein